MDTPRIRWILSIFLATLTNYWATAGPPVPPSHLECYRPYNEEDRWVDIHCIWDRKPNLDISTNYSLYWEPANTEDWYGSSGSSSDGIIPREKFSNGELRVWVQAWNQHGSAKSQEVVFNTEDIIKPPPPKFVRKHLDPLEIYWTSPCSDLQKSSGACDLQYRTQEDQEWVEHEGGFHGSYTLEDSKPCIVYEIQIRCSCGRGLMSDWSEIYRINTAEAAPVGEVDVWRDCDMYPADCVLTWKNLSISQACGFIWGFEIKLFYNNVTVGLNVSTTEPIPQIVYDGLKWYLNSSLRGVSSVNVSAYNSHSVTVPSHLSVTTGHGKNDESIQLSMNEENLTVSWNPPQHIFDNLKEYVVQYKEVGSAPGHDFDWIKVNKSLKRGSLKGHFKKYTPYRVSVFTVSLSSEVRQFSSKITYSLQKAPSTVPLFKVSSISTTDVTLFWKPVPLSKQNGLILYYEIGVDTDKVYNVTATPQQEDKTFTLNGLNPGQGYEVWIRAVNGAGPGGNLTTRFHTKKHENVVSGHVISAVVAVGILVLVTCCFGLLCSNICGESKVRRLMPQCLYEKVPDPGNSHIFRQMKHQINEPLMWICIPVYEPHTKISLLEIVEMKSVDDDPDRSVWSEVGDGRSQMDSQEDQRNDAFIDECFLTDHRFRREDYSKMVDSDEDNLTSSSEEEQFTSGYEKHFMPTAVEVQEV